jgi:DNA-binding LacI/PurR family transcriptional regulator
MLPDPPTAIIGINDPTAIGAMHAAMQQGLIIGEDLAVTGFDGMSDIETIQPSLTTLNQSVYEIGRRLVQMLYRLISGESLDEQHVYLKPDLVIRASSGGEVF